METQPAAALVVLRPLERGDLNFVHQLNNNRNMMGYWFEEPYESFVELEELFSKHIHDQIERRFIIEDRDRVRVGLVELVEINHLHRRAEFLIMVAPEFQRRGYAGVATRLVWVSDDDREESMALIERLKMGGVQAERLDPWSEGE